MLLPYGIWRRRILKELESLRTFSRVRVENLKETNDSFEFNVIIIGAAIIDQEGNIGTEHKINFVLSRQYPYQMPIATWISPVWHPNVSLSGGICLGALKTKNWNDKHDIKEVCMSIVNFLISPDATDPFNRYAADWYKANPGHLLKAKKKDREIQTAIESGTYYAPGTYPPPAGTVPVSTGQNPPQITEAGSGGGLSPPPEPASSGAPKIRIQPRSSENMPDISSQNQQQPRTRITFKK
ncbi:MAG: ubiquitin-conjugating enzyme E2 [Thermoplasmata archaeon]